MCVKIQPVLTCFPLHTNLHPDAPKGLRSNVKTWEEAEDASKFKNQIQQVERARAGKAKLQGRVDHIENQVCVCCQTSLLRPY